MITKEQVDSYIDKIPPASKTLQATQQLLHSGDLPKAAKIAQSDTALNAYLTHMLNKPIYGFRNEVHELSQIFGILGVAGSQQAVYNYMINLLSPDKWELFSLNKTLFATLQDELSVSWQKILLHLNIDDKEIQSAITLLPASIIVTEALFKEKKEDVALLRSVKNLDYNTILVRLAGITLFDLCEQIARKWNMSDTIIDVVKGSSGEVEIADEQTRTLAKWMHLLLFYQLSKPAFIEAELNDFIEFQIDFVGEVYEDFASLMEIA